MKISLIQMNVSLGNVPKNVEKAKMLIEQAMEEKPDAIVLPELWDIGFFPKDNLKELADKNGKRIQSEIGALAKKYCVNIVAGSVADMRNGRVYNTSYIFDRAGRTVARYDKTHLFSPMNEERFFAKGGSICRFSLDGVPCGIIICYDLRFPELARKLALEGASVLFIPAEWPSVRTPHFEALVRARAIENQMFVAAVNARGRAGETHFGGKSAIVSPLGEVLANAYENEEVITAECDIEGYAEKNKSINVFCDRRTDLYTL